MRRYVVGFLFSEDKRRVLLIRKVRPVWQNGMLNGPGGKIRKQESSLHAMIREFREEAIPDHVEPGEGLNLLMWEPRVTVTVPNFEVTFFQAFYDQIDEAKTQTDEELVIVEVRDIYVGRGDLVNNIDWIIPLMLDQHIEGIVNVNSLPL